MNKFLRYLIFVLLLAGVAYAVYHFMNKPVAKVEEVTTVVADATDPVSSDSGDKVQGETDSGVQAVAEETTSNPVAEPETTPEGQE